MTFKVAMGAWGLQASLASHPSEGQLSLRQAPLHLGYSKSSCFWKPICPLLCFVFDQRS